MSDFGSWVLRNVLMGGGLIALGVVLIAGLVEIWPAATTLTGTTPLAHLVQTSFVFGAFTLRLSADTSLLVVAIITGALGAYASAALAFGEHLGVKDFSDSWTWWYALRIPVGITMGVLVYLAFRGGFLSSPSATKDVNPYGVGALAGLAGLFSRQATAKLESAFGGGSGSSGPRANPPGGSGSGGASSPVASSRSGGEHK